MKRLLFQNQRLIDAESSNICNGYDVAELTYLNQFFKNNALGEFTHVRLHEILNDPKKLISDIIKCKIPDIDPHTGLRNNKDAIIAQIELPRIDPDKISRLKIFVNKGFNSFYDFDNGVKLNEVRLQTYLDKHRMFTNDPDILDAFDELSKLAEQLNSLNEKLNIVSLNSQTFGPSEIFFDKLSEIYRISEQGLKLTQQGFELAVRNLKKSTMN
jgi:hypothetical protein